MATTAVQRGGPASALYDVLDLILDKGLVVDVFARVSLVGIELITVDVRVVIASVDTYLRFAEATNRLDLQAPRGASPLTGALTGATGQLTGAAQDVAAKTGATAGASKGS
jgi:hypothetical protein